MNLARQVTRMGEKMSLFTVLVRETEGKNH
jgi:hypothetical protein